MIEALKKRFCKMKVAKLKAKIKKLESNIRRNNERKARLEIASASMQKQILELNQAIYMLDDLEHKVLLLLVNYDQRMLAYDENERYFLYKVGSRPDGTTWTEWLCNIGSLEEAKLKAAIEGVEMRVLKDSWCKVALECRVGIGVFSLDELSTVASEPL